MSTLALPQKSASNIDTATLLGFALSLSALAGGIALIAHLGPTWFTWPLMGVAVVSVWSRMFSAYRPNLPLALSCAYSAVWMATMIVAASTVVLLLPYATSARASANLNGQPSAVVQSASGQLRDNPLMVGRVMTTLKPLGYRDTSYDPAQISAFQKAYDAGLRSAEIDRVLANGFVSGVDRVAFIQTLVSAQPTHPQALALLAQFQDSPGTRG